MTEQQDSGRKTVIIAAAAVAVVIIGAVAIDNLLHQATAAGDVNARKRHKNRPMTPER